MGYVYKGRAVLPDSLSMIHSQIARGLNLDIALVKKTFPESRRAKAEEILNDIEFIHAQTPSLWSLAGIANGLVGIALMPMMDSDISRVLIGTMALSLCATSYMATIRDQNARAEGARHDVLMKFTILAADSDEAPVEKGLLNPNPVPWRENDEINLFAP